MRFKVECRYAYGWDDAGWTDEMDDGVVSTRFETVVEAKAELAEFIEATRAAVIDGNMDAGANSADYRIVEVRV